VIELAVGQILSAGNDGEGSRRARGLLGEALRSGPARPRPGRVVPFAGSLVARRSRESRQGREVDLRIGDRRRHLEQEPFDAAGGGRGVEEVRVVLERAHQTVGIIEERQQQVVAGLPVVGVHRLEAGAGDVHPGGLAAENLDERLDQRLPAGIAFEAERLDELAKRQVLMGI